MQVLVVEQHEAPSIGIVGDMLRDLGVETRTFWGARGDALPGGHRDHDGLIVLGGVMSALDDDLRPYFPSLSGRRPRARLFAPTPAAVPVAH